MPIYEFACPPCRKIYSFLSKRLNPGRGPACPVCGNRKLEKQITSFALLQGASGEVDGEAGAPDSGPPLPDLDDPKVARAMEQMERNLDQLDENNPRQMGQMLRQMKDLMPSETLPKDFERAIRRLEAGEDPEKIEADMGDVLDQWRAGKAAGGKRPTAAAAYTKDPGLYDY